MSNKFNDGTNDKFKDATQRVHNLVEMYRRLDASPSRRQWYFTPNYPGRDTCGFVFAHPNPGSDESYKIISAFSDILEDAGIRCNLTARDHKLSDVTILPEYAELARKLFARYELDPKDETKTRDALFGHFNGYQK